VSAPSPSRPSDISKVEATTLNQRARGLLPQDAFIRDNIGANDVLVVSVGGNDVALAPTPCTLAAMGGLVCCVPMWMIEEGGTCCEVPVNDFCCGCGPSLLSCLCAVPPCLGYFRHLFGTRVKKYVEAITKKTRPKKVLVCMIYYPDESPTPSWANSALAAMGYNTNPGKLQLIIRKMLLEGTSRIQIPGTEVIPVPLYRALDGKTSSDYVARVEPSAVGGKKMAELILDAISNSYASPTSSTMQRFS